MLCLEKGGYYLNRISRFFHAVIFWVKRDGFRWECFRFKLSFHSLTSLDSVVYSYSIQSNCHLNGFSASSEVEVEGENANLKFSKCCLKVVNFLSNRCRKNFKCLTQTDYVLAWIARHSTSKKINQDQNRMRSVHMSCKHRLNIASAPGATELIVFWTE